MGEGESTGAATDDRSSRGPIRTTLRIVVFPLRLGVAAASTGARTGYQAGRFSVRVGRAVGRRAGTPMVAAFLAGAIAGLLVSRSPGRSLRRALGGVLRGGPSDDELAEALRFELAHSPRTWNLEQPTVGVVGGVATLSGEAADEMVREALERAARSVVGISDVRNELVAI